MRSAAAVTVVMLSAETTLIVISHVMTAVLGMLAVRSTAYVAAASVLLLALVYQRFTSSIVPIIVTQLLCFVYITAALVRIFKRRRRPQAAADAESDTDTEANMYSSESDAGSDSDQEE